MDRFAKDKRKRIVVIGGSLCGLMHAIALKRLGHNVLILEKSDKERAGYAAGITAREDVIWYMEIYDLTKGKYFVDAPTLQFLDEEGKVKRSINKPLCMTSWNILYHRLRANFDGLESVYVKEIPEGLYGDGEAVYDDGQCVTEVEDVEDQVKLTCQDVRTLKERIITADLVIAADGSSSSIRKMLLPGVERRYSGYVAFRGTVPQSEVSAETLRTFIDKTTLFSMSNPRNYILLYNIQGDETGDLTPGSQLLNYVWYWNIPETELSNVMTDVDGRTYRNMLPVGKIRPEIWTTQIAHAPALFSPWFLELIEKTKQPFISVVNDHFSPRAAFFDGRLLLVGDALSQFHPHAALSTNQAALHALSLVKVMEGEMSIRQWEGDAIRYAEATKFFSTVLGIFGQGSVMSFVVSVMKYLVCVARQKISWL